MFVDGVAIPLVAECAAARQRRPKGSMRPLGGGNGSSSEMFDGPRARWGGGRIPRAAARGEGWSRGPYRDLPLSPPRDL
ncbi:hypothetical protein MTP99_016371 [Tenebrio molitor]|jgi:hypothetical protein|nr:hypothetical protein MTP99_016371 [Tenebrio molitor]